MRITSFSNPKIKAIRALKLRKHRKATGLFVAEGTRVVYEALELGYPIDTLVMCTDADGGERHLPAPLRDLIEGFRAGGGACLEVSRPVMEAISGKDNAPGLVAVAHQKLTDLDAVEPDSAPIWVALEGVRDPGNLGTIVRTADAVGAGGVILLGQCCDPFGFEAVRATMGSLFSVPLIRTDLPSLEAWRRGVRLIGTSLRATCDFRAVCYEPPVLLLMGNEQSGLPEACEDACDALVRIPMAGRADSLNLAVSTGVMLYEIQRRTGARQDSTTKSTSPNSTG